MAHTRSRLNAVLSMVILLSALSACGRKTLVPGIVIAQNASWHERVAAKELRRYFYVRTGILAGIREAADFSRVRGDAVVVFLKGAPAAAGLGDAVSAASIAALGNEDYLLRTLKRPSGNIVLVAGGSGPAVLYGAYRLAETTGVRFYLDGDVAPDARTASLAFDIDETGHPLFAVRGIQPFHDFPEGPDWWTRENYKAVLGQLPKMRMNFLGLHTYPDNPSKEPGATPNAEPTVWIGREADVSSDGKVLASYPSSYQNTARGNWGYEAKKTGDFHFGASLLFQSDNFGNDVMEGFCPEPKTAEASNEVFDRAASVFRDSFGLARKLGVKTCVGTETALTVPGPVAKRLKDAGRDPKDPAVIKELYKGMFKRIADAYPIDYYWFWTNEGWTWSDAGPAEISSVTTDLDMAVRAWTESNPPFRLATCGWVLGPPSNRTLFDQVMPKGVAMSCINREVGKTPVDPGFSRISGRSLWAIPWLEDDPSLTSTQLWVGRMRRDAADARRYGCDGLLGIHWRTRILSANVLALARAAWEQPWNELPKSVAEDIGPITGQFVSFPRQAIAGAAPAEQAVYRDVRDRVFAYSIPVPNGAYTVTLKFVEGQVSKPKERVFDVLLQGKKVIDGLDIAARAGRFRALDFTFRNVEVSTGRLAIDFADRINYPSIAAIVVQGQGFTKKINCGGPAVDGYEADWPETPRFMPSIDFYRDWAVNQFGPAAGPEAAEIFARIDGHHPIPVTWIGGPGNIQPDGRPWAEVEREYEFADALSALAPKISGAGYEERFDYWRRNFAYMRDVAHFNCLWAEYDRAMGKARAIRDPQAERAFIKDSVLPLRRQMAAILGRVYDALLANASTTGELGTIANWEQHLLPGAWEKPEAELRKLLGEELPGDIVLPREYRGALRVFIPAVRTAVEPGEGLDLKVIVLARQTPQSVTLHWRALGGKSFTAVTIPNVARGVYRLRLPPLAGDIEYYVSAAADGHSAAFPPTAPELNQTVIVY